MKYLTVRQHFWEYARKSLIICAVCYGVPVLIALFGLNRKGMVWLTLGLLILFFLTWGVLLLRGMRFLMAIRKQEAQGLSFETGPLQWLGTSYTSTWLSENWLIHAGHVALHRSQIAAVSYQHSNNKNIFRAVSHDIIITTVSGCRYCWPLSKNGAQKIIRWHSSQKAPSPRELAAPPGDD